MKIVEPPLRQLRDELESHIDTCSNKCIYYDDKFDTGECHWCISNLHETIEYYLNLNFNSLS